MKTLAQRIKGRTKSDPVQQVRAELTGLARLIRGEIRYYSESLETAEVAEIEARGLRARIESMETVLGAIGELRK